MTTLHKIGYVIAFAGIGIAMVGIVLLLVAGPRWYR